MFNIGDRVRVLSDNANYSGAKAGEEGEVLSGPDADAEYLVSVKNVNWYFGVNDIELVDKASVVSPADLQVGDVVTLVVAEDPTTTDLDEFFTTYRGRINSLDQDVRIGSVYLAKSEIISIKLHSREFEVGQKVVIDATQALVVEVGEEMVKLYPLDGTDGAFWVDPRSVRLA